MSRNAWSRRNWLSAFGLASVGGAFALPWLETLSAKAAPEAPPLRLLIVYTPNGTYPKDWFPTAGSDERSFSLGSIHQPLSHHRSRLTLFRGIDNQIAQDPKNHGGPHQRGLGALFTGQKLQTGEFADGCGATAGWADGASLDQVVASLIGMSTPFKSLELGVHCLDNDVQGRISYSGPGLPLPPMNAPQDVYQRLFSNFVASPTTGDVDPEKVAISAAVHKQFGLLSGKLGTEDRIRLDAHLSLLTDLERRLGISGQPGLACEKPEVPKTLDVASEIDMPALSRAQLDLLAVAFACDLTRVASLTYSSGFNRLRFPFLDDFGEGHQLSHSGDTNLEAWAALSGRAAWHAGELAYFLDLLAEMPEGDGSVLDHTLVVWGSEVSQGNSHALTNIPFLLIGDLAGKLKSGRFHEYAARSHADLLSTIARAYGSEASTFGLPEYNEGPLEELLA